MKKIFVAVCMMAFAFLVSAQGGQGGQGRGFQMSPERQAQWYETLKKEMKLTDKQLADIKKVDEEYMKKMQAAREKAGDDREKMREEMTKLRAEQNTKIKPLVSAEQFKKYEELQAQRFQRRNN